MEWVEQPFIAVESEHFDMLPFIGLLMCVLGVLLFVTLSVAALAIGPNVKEGWLPIADENERKIPVLIEWDGSRALVHTEKQVLSIQAFSGAELSPTAELSRFVIEMKATRNTHYVLFAVRPSGFGNFQILADRFRTERVDVGYEPIPQDKSVRLLKKTQ